MASSGTASTAVQRLYEEFFELTDIEKQFPPVFERFFASQDKRTCKHCGDGDGAA